jgi:hypothetical protein
MWDVRAAFLGGSLIHTRFNEKTEQNLLCLLPAEPIFGRTLSVPFIFVADAVFAFPVNIMKPYATHNPECSFLEKIFNYRLSRQYRIVENVFETLSAKFRVFKTETCCLHPNKVTNLKLFV